MNISSLPNEILLDIFGRLDSDSIESILLLNKRFNYVVERNKLYRPIAGTIKFSSRMENDNLIITVSTPRKRKNLRKKQFSLCIPKEDVDESVNDKLATLLSKFRLHGVISIDLIDMDVTVFNVAEVLEKSDIPLCYLRKCRTNKHVKLPFVTREFMHTLVARNPKYIIFRNCETALNLEDVYGYLRNCAPNVPDDSIWQFGLLDVSLKAQVDAWRILFGMDFDRVVQQDFDNYIKENMIVEASRGTFMWQYTNRKWY